MRLVKRILLTVLAIVVALAGLAVGGAYAYLRLGASPIVSGRVQVPGLQAAVEVVRDRWGVPHLYARDNADLFFAQGYVQAQDRFWQMEQQRRTARGTLAQVLGEEALASDRLARTLNLGGEAEQEWALLDPTTRQALAAYTAGVNAFIGPAGARLPVEFRLLGYTPAPWQPQDSLAVARLAAWSQSSGWQSEVLAARVVAAVGPQRAAQLLPDLPGDALSADLSALARPLLPELVGEQFPWASSHGVGGNAWAVSGALTASGQPLLAADVQLAVQAPSPLYEMQLSGGDYEVSGATLPGFPGVLVGRNRDVAWGVTFGVADSQDLVIERVRQGEPLQAEHLEQWEDVQVREEAIVVRGTSAPDRLIVYTTRHGPLLTDPTDGQELQVALRWAGAGQPSGYAAALLALNRAGDWGAFRAAAAGWTSPAIALVYADRSGNIGSFVAGSLPRRGSGQGGIPQPGWSTGADWNGFVPADGLPATLNPESGMVIAANVPLAADGRPDALAQEAGYAERAARLQALLTGANKFTLADMAAMQMDDSGPAEPLLAQLLALPAMGWREGRTVPYLKEWDQRYGAESAGAGVFESFYYRLAHNILDDDLGAALVDEYLNDYPGQRAVLDALSQDPTNPWFDDARTPEKETRDTLLALSLTQGTDGLGRRFGDLPYEWNWGRVHNITFKHVMGARWPLTILLNRGAMRAGGAAWTLNTTTSDYGARQIVRAAPAYRLLVDMAAGGASEAQSLLGQAGQFYNPHYADLLPAWRAGTYHPLPLQREAVLQVREATLTLAPGN
jgi:penicillin G amidase